MKVEEQDLRGRIDFASWTLTASAALEKHDEKSETSVRILSKFFLSKPPFSSISLLWSFPLRLAS